MNRHFSWNSFPGIECHANSHSLVHFSFFSFEFRIFENMTDVPARTLYPEYILSSSYTRDFPPPYLLRSLYIIGRDDYYYPEKEFITLDFELYEIYYASTIAKGYLHPHPFIPPPGIRFEYYLHYFDTDEEINEHISDSDPDFDSFSLPSPVLSYWEPSD